MRSILAGVAYAGHGAQLHADRDGATALDPRSLGGPYVRSEDTATRVTRGAISLSSSTHFAPKRIPWVRTGGGSDIGRARIANTHADRGRRPSRTRCKVRVALLQCLNAWGSRGQDGVRASARSVLGISGRDGVAAAHERRFGTLRPSVPAVAASMYRKPRGVPDLPHHRSDEYESDGRVRAVMRARAATGQANAALPSSVKNSRR